MNDWSANEKSKKSGYYWLSTHDEKTLVYYYKNPDTDSYGFGFNTADGGGFLPESDLLDATEVVWAGIEEPGG